MLGKLLVKFLGQINGRCADCGHEEIEFVYDKDTNQYALACKRCGGRKIRDISFSHMKKVFRVDFVDNARVEMEKREEKD